MSLAIRLLKFKCCSDTSKLGSGGESFYLSVTQRPSSQRGWRSYVNWCTVRRSQWHEIMHMKCSGLDLSQKHIHCKLLYYNVWIRAHTPLACLERSLHARCWVHITYITSLYSQQPSKGGTVRPLLRVFNHKALSLLRPSAILFSFLSMGIFFFQLRKDSSWNMVMICRNLWLTI